MLAGSEKRLRWWGMDMRPRWRRRVAAVWAYVVLFVGCELIGTYESTHLYWRGFGVICFSAAWIQFSVFRKMGPVKAFEEHLVGLGTPWLDERERKERDSAERWTLNQLATYLAVFAGLTTAAAAHHHPIDPMEIAVELWLFCQLARTLPKARVLWTERDPREMVGEMEVVGGVEA